MLSFFCLWLLMLSLFSVNSDTVKIELNDLELAHANNAARMKNLILRETGKPIITAEKMREVQAQFNDTAQAYALYHEEEAYEEAAFIGHSADNTSDIVSFVLGAEAANSRIESAKLVFFLRAASDVKAKKVHLAVKDENNAYLVNASLTVPNSPTKRYAVSLNTNVLQRSVTDAKDETGAVLSLTISALASGADQLLLKQGRKGFEPHMAMVIEMRFASAKLQAKLRRRKRATRSKMGLLPNQCKPDQTDCCPHIQDFTWKEMGINNIIAPEKFHSVVCRGHCRNFVYHDYKHTITRQAIAEYVRDPCCHPIEYEEQHVIYVDTNGNPVQKKIHNFYATRCICD